MTGEDPEGSRPNARELVRRDYAPSHGPADPSLSRRRDLGQDLRDEVWEGTHHVAPPQHGRNGSWRWSWWARWPPPPGGRAGLRPGGSFNLGEPDDYRVPDLGFHERSACSTLYYSSAPLVVEVLSPDDETFAKLPFYASRGVVEVWVADPLQCTVRCWRLTADGYAQRDHSELLRLTMTAVQSAVDWPDQAG